MKLLTGLFRACRKRLLTTDTDMGAFRQKLDELIAQKETLTDEDVAAKVEELKQITNDLPDDEGKAELLRYLEDFKAIKEQDEAVAKKAAEVVANQFEKLDTAAMQDAPAEEEPVESEDSAEEEIAEEATEETVAPEGEEEETVEEETAKDADPNAEYSMEEIYQFIKKRMAEDAECGADEEDTEDDGEEIDQEEEDEVVTDHAPRIPVTVNDGAAKGDLFALVEMAKRGK